MRPRAAARVAVALALAALPGCGLVTLVHDSTIGPASPAGRIHDLAVGSDFHVTERGPVAEMGGEPLLRPYPPDLLRRLAEPSSFYSAIHGFEAFMAGVSPVVSRETRIGRPALREGGGEPRPGTAAAEVLQRLGAPELWIRRESGSLMLYRSELHRTFSFYVGVPPVAAAFIPVPGAGNLRVRWAREQDRASKLLLFFDRDDRLEAAIAGADPWTAGD